MSLWSTLARVGGLVGSVAAAPFTGGASLAGVPAFLSTAGKIAGAVAPALGAISGGRQAGREVDAVQNFNQDRNALTKYGIDTAATQNQNQFALNRGNLANDNASMDLKQRQFALDAPSTRGKTALLGDFMSGASKSNLQQLPGVHQFDFGRTQGADTQALGRLLSSGALAGQQKGDTFDPSQPLPDYVSGPASPSLTALPKSGTLDSVLNTAATVGSFADLLGKYKRKPNPPPPQLTNPYGLDN